ncbi:MAG: hypothetical protein ABR874_08135 [Candidatus Sulfotelmatobacter sp.]
MFWGLSEDYLLERDCPAKSVTGCCRAFSVAAVMCCCLLPGMATGQADTATHASLGKKPGSARATGKSATAGKNNAGKTSATSSKSSTAPTKTNSTHSASTAHTGSTVHRKSSTVAVAHNAKGKRARSKKTTARGQQKIDPERAEEIQEALIREHYLTGEPAGTWNQASEDALRRYQADHGWQSKTVPDARALINLGLGPSHDHLLNPESAMTTGPEVSHSASLSSSGPVPVSHSAEAGSTAGPVAPADPSQPPNGDQSRPQR